MKLLAIDPGVTTGYCFGQFDGTHVTISPHQHVDTVEDFWDRLEAFAPNYIVCEDFEYRNAARAGLVLFSVQLIGVVSLYEAKRQAKQDTVCELKLQKAAQGKGYYSDNTMKNLGLYMKGIPHAMDATRHLLHWLSFGGGYRFIQGKQIEEVVRLKQN